MSSANFQKVAILLSSLPDEQSAEVMKGFGDEEIERISREMLSLAKVDQKTRLSVLQEFHQSLTGANGSLKEGSEYVEGILARAFGVRGTRRARAVDVREADADRG